MPYWHSFQARKIIIAELDCKDTPEDKGTHLTAALFLRSIFSLLWLALLKSGQVTQPRCVFLASATNRQQLPETPIYCSGGLVSVPVSILDDVFVHFCDSLFWLILFTFTLFLFSLLLCILSCQSMPASLWLIIIQSGWFFALADKTGFRRKCDCERISYSDLIEWNTWASIVIFLWMM